MINIDRKIQVISITPDTWNSIKFKNDLSGTIGGWIFHKQERTLEEKIEQVKTDMYKNRYKTLITKIST